MLSNQRVRILKEKIVNHHGRIEEIRLFETEPSPEQLLMDRSEIANEKKLREKAGGADNQEEEKVAEGKKKAKVADDYENLAEEFDDETEYLYKIFRDRKVEAENIEKKATFKAEPGQPRLTLPDACYYGYKDKEEADEHPVKVYYDFHPFNNKDPVLLTLMVTDPKSKKE